MDHLLQVTVRCSDDTYIDPNFLLSTNRKHYFFLENTVQRWYVVADRLKAAVAEESNRPEQEDRP